MQMDSGVSVDIFANGTNDESVYRKFLMVDATSCQPLAKGAIIGKIDLLGMRG